MKLFFKFLSITGAVILMMSSYAALAKENTALRAKHQKIIQDFPSVKHVSAQDLQEMKKDDVIIFDIRERGEFGVSHMATAIFVPPEISADDFLNQYREKAKGKTVVFYCSVGQRSSILANKVQDALITSGSGPVYNLEGGLFNWHNENLPLVTPSAEPTEYIHPYNYFWGRMVNQKSKKRYKSKDK